MSVLLDEIGVEKDKPIRERLDDAWRLYKEGGRLHSLARKVDHSRHETKDVDGSIVPGIWNEAAFLYRPDTMRVEGSPLDFVSAEEWAELTRLLQEGFVLGFSVCDYQLDDVAGVVGEAAQRLGLPVAVCGDPDEGMVYIGAKSVVQNADAA